MKRFILLRCEYMENQILGRLFVMDDTDLMFSCATIERGWHDNEKRISAIPAGTFDCAFTMSPRFQKLLWEIYVRDREGIRIHQANFARQLNGCISVGRRHVDLDRDGKRDVTDSVKTLAELHNVMSGVDKTTIQIIGYGGDSNWFTPDSTT